MKKTTVTALTLSAALLLTACAGGTAGTETTAVPQTEVQSTEPVSETVTTAAPQTEAQSTEPVSEAVTTAAPQTEAQSTEPVSETVTSPDGWSLTYEPALVRMEEKDGVKTFTYTGYPGGEASFSISYVAEKLPREILYEVTADIDDSRITRSEGFYCAGKVWAFDRSITPAEGEDLNETYTAIEHNGGSVLIYTRVKNGTDEEEAELMNDTMAETLSTLSFPGGCVQKEFDYCVGTYEHTYEDEIEGTRITITDRITLNADHNGTLDFQDTVPCIWTSYEILTNDGSTRQEFNIEGDTLYLQEGEGWTAFEKVG